MNEDFITNTLKKIKDQTGLELKLCDCFTGVSYLDGAPYFNVVLEQRLNYNNPVMNTLERYFKQYGGFRIEPNGVHRLAIISTKKQCTN